MTSTSRVQRWFVDALRPADPRPSPAASAELAREFQVIVNRQSNAPKDRVEDMKDATLADHLDRKLQKVMHAAGQLLFAMRELENDIENHHWVDSNGSVSVDDIMSNLRRIGAVTVVPAPPPSRGRPRQEWHAAAREMARLIAEAMRRAGYRGRLSMVDGESVTAEVGAAAINWFYGTKIDAAGFAAAMRMRDRRKRGGPGDFADRFPDAMRIKVIP
jgi:hypothetical protein